MNATYTLNTAKNGIEVTFDSKPSTETLNLLKSSGYRWSRARHLWWARQSPDTLAAAQAVAEQGEAVKNQADKDTDRAAEVADKAEQVALKAEYLEILARDVWKNDSKMIEYARKTIARIVRLECGGMVAIEKPTIETSFCFGYSLNRCNSDEYDQANKDARSAKSDQDYFTRKNMEKVEKMIEALKQSGIYSINHYIGTPPNHPIRTLEWENHRMRKPEGAQPITEADRSALIEAWEKVGRDFRRRLDSYLKRYGMSKVKTWSYWRDE